MPKSNILRRLDVPRRDGGVYERSAAPFRLPVARAVLIRRAGASLTRSEIEVADPVSPGRDE